MKFADVLIAAAPVASLGLMAGSVTAQNHAIREIHKKVVNRIAIKKKVSPDDVCRTELRNHRKVRVCR